MASEADTRPSESVRSVYVMLAVIAISIVAGRIAVVVSREGDTAFLSANDRSRWCTIASLVETGSYEIDSYLTRTGEKRNRRPWYTIDLVRHQGDDGELHFYSSKPPLLPTIYAGGYWLVRQSLGMSLSDHPLYLARILLALFNLPVLALFLLCTILSIDRVTRTRWAKIFLASCVCFGTMLLPFTVSLSNHLPAAASASVVLFFFTKYFIGSEQRLTLPSSVLAGLAAGFLAANELPALSIVAFWGAMLLWLDRRSVIGYSLGVVVVGIAFFAVNWIAHGSLRPPYTHRGIGDEIGQFDSESMEVDPLALKTLLTQKELASNDDQIVIEPARVAGRLRVSINKHQLFALQLTETDSSPDNLAEKNGSHSWTLRQWDDWYDYPGSYWVDGRRQGVDLGEPSRATYLTNMTIGHHGLFSLTPIWLLVPLGFVGCLRPVRVNSRNHYDTMRWRALLATIVMSSLVCAVFYVMRPEIDRNYGGVSVCFRWMLWFAPLWLFAMSLPVDWLGERAWGRVFCVVLLAASASSMSTALSSPWQSPWLYRFWDFLGWLGP
ncbi:MAG: hypothetical protein AAF802_13790 [Planctomycetota bacterium]